MGERGVFGFMAEFALVVGRDAPEPDPHPRPARLSPRAGN